LGMFIGFSFLGCFSSAYDAVKRIINQAHSNKVQQSS
jgi:hypothetical protein